MFHEFSGLGGGIPGAQQWEAVYVARSVGRLLWGKGCCRCTSLRLFRAIRPRLILSPTTRMDSRAARRWSRTAHPTFSMINYTRGNDLGVRPDRRCKTGEYLFMPIFIYGENVGVVMADERRTDVMFVIVDVEGFDAGGLCTPTARAHAAGQMYLLAGKKPHGVVHDSTPVLLRV